MHKISAIAILFFTPILSFTQFFVSSDSLDKTRLISVITSESIGSVGSIILLNEIWYKQYPRSAFHSFDDRTEWLQMDKVGHAMTSYYLGYAGYEVLDWCGANEKRSIIYGGTLGLGYLTMLEILDGFSSEWGFSYTDMLSNTLGSGLFISQQFLWKEQRIKMKFSSHLTPIAAYRPNLLGSSNPERILKDYNGQTYWLSVNIKDFLNTDSNFPSWLNLAIGYGADGMTGGKENKAEYCNGDPTCLALTRNRQLYLSLDADLTKIKWKRKFFHTLFGSFGFIKIPFPTIEISKSTTKFYWMYF